MIEFVNAKINLGLQVVNRREDGYHDLQTVFYPVGVYAGTPQNPEVFCDILEVSERGAKGEERGERDCFEVVMSGRKVDCPLEKNLVYKAAKLFYDTFHPDFKVRIGLHKNLPDGAGMGGGSADASFTLKALAGIYNARTSSNPFDDSSLETLALRLGADCPFFIKNRPAYAEGVGEKLEPIDLDLSGYWLLVVKPDIYISTKEAFAGVTPKPADFDLRQLASIPIKKWQGLVHNDFEDSIFPNHPEMAEIKLKLIDTGALYASLTGSGSCLYGIYKNLPIAENAREVFEDYQTWVLELTLLDFPC